MKSSEEYEKGLDADPKRTIFKILLWGMLILCALGAIGWGISWFAEAGQVAKEEFGARASLKKYEWFVTTAETITEKQQNIAVYQNNLNLLIEDYGDTPRKDWDRLDKEQKNQWSLEVAGLTASYNKVVKDYNAQSKKFNWDLYNTADIPPSFDLYAN